MSAKAPAAAAAPPPTADPQDPLPESNWVARRWFVFLLAGLTLVAIAAILYLLHSLGTATLDVIARLSTTRDVRALDQSLEVVRAIITGLVQLGRGLVGVIFALLIAYLIAPSAEQATKMLATVWAWKGGISTSSTARSTAPDGSTAEASTTAGPATGAQATPQAAEPPAAPSAPAEPVSAPVAAPAADTAPSTGDTVILPTGAR